MFSIIFVTYNSGEVIADALRSVPSGTEIIVVDNASTDDSVEICRALGATVLEMPKNLGFGTACNRGAEAATAENLLFLNPDARLEPGALDALADALHRYPDAAAFNPRILNEDGSQFLRRRTILLPRPYLFRPPAPTGDEKIITATGAALLIRNDVFSEIGGFDENIFLYYEDDDISTRIIKKGYDVFYIHSSVVVHKIGKSTAGHETDTSSYFREYESTRSRIYVSRKHGIRIYRRWELLKSKIKLRLAQKRGDTRVASSLSARISALNDHR